MERYFMTVPSKWTTIWENSTNIYVWFFCQTMYAFPLQMFFWLLRGDFHRWSWVYPHCSFPKNVDRNRITAHFHRCCHFERLSFPAFRSNDIDSRSKQICTIVLLIIVCFRILNFSFVFLFAEMLLRFPAFRSNDIESRSKQMEWNSCTRVMSLCCLQNIRPKHSGNCRWRDEKLKFVSGREIFQHFLSLCI
jgi:hypothetical protein